MHRMHKVRSLPLVSRPPERAADRTEDAPEARGDAKSQGQLALGAALLLFGSIGWVMGAKFSVIGWHGWISAFVRWVGVPLSLPPIVGWAWLVLVPVGLLYSRVEVKRRPLWRAGGRWQTAPAIHWIGWALIVGTDVGSTFAGGQHVDAGVWGALSAAMLQIAARPPLLIAWSVTLTFLPELLILAGVALLKRR